MKKRISTALAVVLTVALLATSFVAVFATSVFADQAVTTEEITIGNGTYAIVDKSTALDAAKQMTNGITAIPADTPDNWGGLNAETDYSSAFVDTTANGWSFSASILANASSNAALLSSEYTGGGNEVGYNHIAFTPNQQWIMHAYSEVAVIIRDETLRINNGHSWGAGTSTITLSYTADRDGKLVVFDQGKMWAIDWWDSDSQVTVTVTKNGVAIAEPVVVTSAATSESAAVSFPEIAPITVTEGDVIAIEYANNKKWCKLSANPAVAYVYKEQAVEVEEIEIAGQTTLVEKGHVYNAYDDFYALVNVEGIQNKDILDLSNTPWSIESQIADWIPETNAHYMATANTKIITTTTWIHEARGVEMVFAKDNLYVNPGHNQGGDGRFDIKFTAPKNGTVTTYNLINEAWADSDLIDTWPWWERSWKAEFKIKLNGTEIWPAGAENANNSIHPADNEDWYLQYTALRGIEVKKGDIISFEYTTKDARQVHVSTKPMVAYTHEHVWMDAETVQQPGYIVPGKVTTACENCTTVVTENVMAEGSPIIYGNVSYDAVTNTLSIPFTYSNAFMNDLIDSSDWAPFVKFHYIIDGKEYKVDEKLYFYDYADGGVITLSGFNAQRLSQEITVWFTVGWGGNAADNYTNPWPAYGKWNSPEKFAVDSTYTFKAEELANDEKVSTLLNAFENATETVVEGQVSDNDSFIENTIKLDVKKATAYIRFVASDKLIKELAALGRENRTVTLTIKIGNDFSKDIVIEDLRKATMLNISGLSFEQLYGEISLMLSFDYADDTNNFASDEISFTCNTIIDAAETDVANAFTNFMN